MSVSYSKAGMNALTLVGFAYFCVYTGRTSPRAGHRAGPPRVRLRQAGTAAEETNETVRFVRRALGILRQDDSEYPTYIYTMYKVFSLGRYNTFFDSIPIATNTTIYY